MEDKKIPSPACLLVEIGWERRRKLNKYVPHGAKKTIINNMLDVFIEACEVDEATTLGGFITGRLKIVVDREE